MQLQFSALRPSFSLCSCICPIFLGFFSICICSLETFGNYIFYAAAVLEVFRINISQMIGRMVDKGFKERSALQRFSHLEIPGRFSRFRCSRGLFVEILA